MRVLSSRFASRRTSSELILNLAALMAQPFTRALELPRAANSRVASIRVIPSESGRVIEGTLTLRGRSEPVRLQVESPAPGRYRGSTAVRQSAFGITPYSGFFGALRLRDEVGVEFAVDTGRTTVQDQDL